MKKIITIITTLSILMSAIPAYGLGVDMVGTTGTKLNMESSIGTVQDATVKTNAVVEADVKTEANIGVGTKNTVNAKTDINIEANTEMEVISNTEYKSGATSNALIRIGGKTISVDSNISISNTAEVETEEQLAIFLATTAKSDIKVQSIESSEEAVVVTYQESVYLFGFIGVNMERTARVTFEAETGSNTEVSKP
jgi:hypothetical protein